MFICQKMSFNVNNGSVLKTDWASSSQGDSGGPLVCNGMAVGVVSFNMGICDYPNVPNVYVNLSKYIPWIKEIRRKKKC